ncbi:hypothetical protein ACFZAV_43460 [Streptomyces sp. NPDC008343]|uniref:hypothetical protein n=1 Tax=Streptomyces sp. NPDC008343 TaxID=3364828 RepID=UPI0036EB6C64
MRKSQDAIVGAVTDSPAAPRSLLLGRVDTDGCLKHTGRSSTLTQAASATLTGLLSPAAGEHPLTGWTFSAGWGNDGHLECHPAYSPTWSRKSTSTSPGPAPARGRLRSTRGRPEEAMSAAAAKP